MCNNIPTSNSIGDILKVILVLQLNSCPNDVCLETCDRPVLGGGGTCLGCNTRPVMLYVANGNGVPWSMPTTKDVTTSCSDSTTTCSSVFRVEKVEDNCATFRVLQPNSESNSTYPYVTTNCYFTMNLGCLCCLRCLSDTYVECA